jgi:predicted unusual protein kinase regulating ubiquinone biosynthesis (AarF/ABC1/UbiB family)
MQTLPRSSNLSPCCHFRHATFIKKLTAAFCFFSTLWIYAADLSPEQRDRHTLQTFVSQIVRICDQRDVARHSVKLKYLLTHSPEFERLLQSPRRLERAIESQSVPAQYSPVQQIYTPMAKRLLISGGPQLSAMIAYLKHQARTGQSSFLNEQILTRFENQVDIELRQTIVPLKITQMTHINQRIIDKLDLSDFSSKSRDFFVEVVNRYFDEIDFSIKRQIVAGILALRPDQQDDETLLITALENSGPSLQKLFQMIGSKTKKDEDRRLFNRIKSSIPAMDKIDFKDTLREAHLDPSLTIQPQALASATIGEVHLAQLRQPDGSRKEVIAKLLKKGVRESLVFEYALFDDIVKNDEALQPIVSAIKKSVESEFDYGLEVKNLLQGEAMYGGEVKTIAVVQFLGAYPKENPRIILMEKAPGHDLTLDRQDAAYVYAKGEQLARLARMWFKQALYQEGYFHGDFHDGNLFLDFNEGRPENSKLTLIDFSVFPRFTYDEQESLINLMLGISFRNTPTVLKALGYTKLNAHEENWKSFRLFVENTFRNLPAGPAANLEVEISDKALDYKLPLPENIVTFIRGKTLIDNQLQAAIASLKARTNRGENLNFRRIQTPEEIYASVIKRGSAGRCLKMWMFSHRRKL